MRIAGKRQLLPQLLGIQRFTLRMKTYRPPAGPVAKGGKTRWRPEAAECRTLFGRSHRAWRAFRRPDRGAGKTVNGRVSQSGSN